MGYRHDVEMGVAFGTMLFGGMANIRLLLPWMHLGSPERACWVPNNGSRVGSENLDFTSIFL